MYIKWKKKNHNTFVTCSRMPIIYQGSTSLSFHICCNWFKREEFHNRWPRKHNKSQHLTAHMFPLRVVQVVATTVLVVLQWILPEYSSDSLRKLTAHIKQTAIAWAINLGKQACARCFCNSLEFLRTIPIRTQSGTVKVMAMEQMHHQHSYNRGAIFTFQKC